MAWTGGPGWGLVMPTIAPALAAKGKGKAAGGKKTPWIPNLNQWGKVPDLQDALTTSLAAVADAEPDLPEIIKNIEKKVKKVAEKYTTKDEKKRDMRLTCKGTATEAQVIVEECVSAVMATIQNCCYDKPWFLQVNFTNPLLLIVLHAFEGAKIFARTLKPKLIKLIEDGFFKWQEEERTTKAMSDVVELCGIKSSHQKKANQALTKSYDSAHMKAPFGTTSNESPELAVLQDFVKGWMAEFLENGWDVVENGWGDDTSKEAQVSQLTVLFQNLLDPSVAVVPADIATEIMSATGALPPSPWAFIDQAAQEVFAEVEAANQPSAKRRKGMGKK